MSRFLTVVALAWRYLWRRRLATVVSVLAIGLALGLVCAVGLIGLAVQKAAVEGALRTPLVVGPAGASGVQLVFSTIFHIDKPTGTLSAEVWRRLAADPRVVEAHPIALADAVGGYPIVGTTAGFLASLGVGLTAGEGTLATSDAAVLGAEARARTGLALGETFHGSHGLVGDDGAAEHDEHAYRVAGILAPTGGPEDAAIYVPYEAVWALHERHEEPGQAKTPDAHDDDHLTRERLTAVLVRTRNPAHTAALERELSAGGETLAIDTARAIRRLSGWLDRGERLVGLFSGLSLAIALGLVLVTLLMSVEARRRELALLRCLGVGRLTLGAVVAVEATALGLGGALVGLLLGHGGVWWGEWLLRDGLGVGIEWFAMSRLELVALVSTILGAELVAVLSLIFTYRTDLAAEISRD